MVGTFVIIQWALSREPHWQTLSCKPCDRILHWYCYYLWSGDKKELWLLLRCLSPLREILFPLLFEIRSEPIEPAMQPPRLFRSLYHLCHIVIHWDLSKEPRGAFYCYYCLRSSSRSERKRIKGLARGETTSTRSVGPKRRKEEFIPWRICYPWNGGNWRETKNESALSDWHTMPRFLSAKSLFFSMSRKNELEATSFRK